MSFGLSQPNNFEYLVSSMNKVIFLVSLLTISTTISSCSIQDGKSGSLSLTNAQMVKEAPNTYNITVGGNAFSKPEDLADRTKKEADKVCGGDKYTVKKSDSYPMDTTVMVGANASIPVTVTGLQSQTRIVCK